MVTAQSDPCAASSLLALSKLIPTLFVRVACVALLCGALARPTRPHHKLVRDASRAIFASWSASASCVNAAAAALATRAACLAARSARPTFSMMPARRALAGDVAGVIAKVGAGAAPRKSPDEAATPLPARPASNQNASGLNACRGRGAAKKTNKRHCRCWTRAKEHKRQCRCCARRQASF